MQTHTTNGPQHVIGEKTATVARIEPNLIRLLVYWFTTVVILLELLAGSVWNLLTIDWIEAQMDHLGYPHYFAYILGGWLIGAALAIAVPGFGLLKEWAYAGIFLLWSGAVVSHLALGDGPVSWGAPLMFLVLGVASWALRPADRRLPQTRLRRDQRADAGPDTAGRRAWVASIGLIVVLSAISLLTLPVAEEVTSKWPAERGWVDEQRP
ncbi:DoxX family protein [Nocardia otitidiscaviarum]|uniref:DoxX family protein n=1 Tax=Nocardia otitidiscaviarum TaxID=1823 RepID=UPI0024577423|nr:DoxX family protein [Nocardia otitidiscaviarum]